MHVSTSDALFWLFHRHSEIRHSLGKLWKSCLSLTRHFSLAKLELLNTPMSLSRDLSTEAQTHQRILWLLSYEETPFAQAKGPGRGTTDNILAVLALEVIRCLQKGLSCIHTLWSKLMFVYRDCKAGEQECFTALLVVSFIKGSLRQPLGVQREKSPVTATSGDACFQEKV